MGIKTVTKNDDYRQAGAKSEIYSDFNHSFIANPNTRQLPRKTNTEAVKQSLRNMLLTNKYERLRNPEFGTNIRRYLFESFDGHIVEQLENEIRISIQNYEPRVRVIDIVVDPRPDDNSIYINIEFAIVTAKDSTNLELILYRVR